MEHEKRVKIKQAIVKFSSLIIFAALITVATIICIPYTQELMTADGRQHLAESISQFNKLASIGIFTGIQALQVIIAIIPPVQIVGGMLFGWLFGGILSFIGTFIGTLCIFMLVRWIGKPLAEAFVSEKHLKKFEFLNNEKKLIGVLIVLYVIPGIPKDVISYIVPLTKVKRKDFFLYVMPFRLPAILLSTVFGNSLMKGSYTLSIVLVGVFIVIGVIGYFTKDYILDKFKQHKKTK